MQAVGKWSVFNLGIARVKGLEDLVEHEFRSASEVSRSGFCVLTQE